MTRHSVQPLIARPAAGRLALPRGQQPILVWLLKVALIGGGLIGGLLALQPQRDRLAQAELWAEGARAIVLAKADSDAQRPTFDAADVGLLVQRSFDKQPSDVRDLVMALAKRPGAPWWATDKAWTDIYTRRMESALWDAHRHLATLAIQEARRGQARLGPAITRLVAFEMEYLRLLPESPWATLLDRPLQPNGLYVSSDPGAQQIIATLQAEPPVAHEKRERESPPAFALP